MSGIVSQVFAVYKISDVEARANPEDRSRLDGTGRRLKLHWFKVNIPGGVARLMEVSAGRGVAQHNALALGIGRTVLEQAAGSHGTNLVAAVVSEANTGVGELYAALLPTEAVVEQDGARWFYPFIEPAEKRFLGAALVAPQTGSLILPTEVAKTELDKLKVKPTPIVLG